MKAFAALAALCLGACLSEEEGERAILPLAVGNAWSYAETTFHAGEAIDAWASETFVRERRVLEDGREVFLLNVRNRFTGEPSSYSSLTANVGTSNHVYGAEDEGVTVLHQSLHLKWPAVRGERYSMRLIGVDSAAASARLDTLEIEVVAPDTTCRVPAGTFSCVHYRARRPDGSVFADTWYAAGVGQVGSETLREERVGDSTRTLRRVKRLVARSLHPASR